MKILISIFTFCILTTTLLAHTGGNIKYICPLDGTEFEAWQDFSGTYLAHGLILKKNGPIAQPWALAQCPKCRFPLFKEEFSEDEKVSLKKMVAGERFIKESKDSTAYFALGVLKEEMKADPFEIGWIYLEASWEEEGADDHKYSLVAKRAIEWFDRAAAEPQKKEEKKNDYYVAVYLPIELFRRSGDFESASSRLKNFPDLKDTEIEWLPSTLKFEAKLIAAKEKAPHDIGEDEKKK